MFNLDPTKILIIVTVALVVLGPDKLPSALKTVGKYWNEFNRVRGRIRDEMNGALSTLTDQMGPIKSAMGELKDPFEIVATTFTSDPNRTPQGPSKEHAQEMFGKNASLGSARYADDFDDVKATLTPSSQGLRISPSADVFWN
ncbi:MAG: twin-arginine translocase TatA/TatE family subunit [Actinomycetota bacterium]|nr:twin-arginine translocase TatA/TatE family subunit [Actinomycetota bacterium]